jgi:hypothetical protein
MESEGARRLELVLRAGLLRPDDGCLEFVDVAVAQLLAAERICEHDYRWASLHPRYVQVRLWAASILARRREHVRMAEYFVDLERAAASVSPLGWLDIADCLAQIDASQWPGAVKMMPILSDYMKPLVHAACVRVQRAIAERAARLNLPIEVAVGPTGPDELISAESFAALRMTAGIGDLVPGARQRANHDASRRSSVRAIGSLLDQMQRAQSNLIRTQCAAWLQVADLMASVALVPFGVVTRRAPLRSALEELAMIALHPSTSRVTRLLAQSLLADDEHLEQLWQLGCHYAPLVCELELATGKRLWWDPRQQCWVAVRSDQL